MRRESSSSAAARPSAATAAERPARSSNTSGPATVTRHPTWPHCAPHPVGNDREVTQGAADAVGAPITRPPETSAPPMPELLLR